MNTSKIANILHLFYSYRPYVVNDSVTPDIVNIADALDEPDNEVVYLGWEDGEGLEYRIKFTEDGLSNAVVKDGNLVMTDNEGDEIEIAFIRWFIPAWLGCRRDNEGDEIEIAFMESRKHSLVSEDIV